MVAQDREEPIVVGAFAIDAQIGVNELVVVLADIGVDGLFGAEHVVVVAGGQHGIRRPTGNQGGDIRLRLIVHAKVANHRQAQRRSRCFGRLRGLRHGPGAQKAERKQRQHKGRHSDVHLQSFHGNPLDFAAKAW
jgi:hypothetical protein